MTLRILTKRFFIFSCILVFSGRLIAQTTNSFIQDYYQGFLLQYNFGNIAAADIDGDGKKEIIAAGNDSVSIFINTGQDNSLSFSRTSFFTGLTAFGLRACTITDLDMDGKPDIIITGSYMVTKIVVLRNTSTAGNLSFEPPVNFPAMNNTSFITAADLDADGKPEVILSHRQDSAVSIFRNTTTGSVISFDPFIIFRTGRMPSSIAISDLDMDGKPDIAVSHDSADISVLRNTSSGSSINFAPRITIPTVFNDFSFIIAADLDGDNKPDIVKTNYTTKDISTFLNTSSPGSISFAAPVNHIVQNSTIIHPRMLAAADIDNDGKTDIIAGCELEFIYGNGVTLVMKNESMTGNISFGARITVSNGFPTSLLVTDMQNDGKPDITVMSSNDYAYFLSVARNRTGEAINLALCQPPMNNTVLNAGIDGSTYQWQVSTDSVNFTPLVNNSNYTGVDTKELVLNALPSSNYGNFYRCVVDGIPYDPFRVRFRNTWLSSSFGPWSDVGKWSCNVVPDQYTDVIIAGGQVTINSNVTVNTLTVLPGASVTVSPGFNLTILH